MENLKSRGKMTDKKSCFNCVKHNSNSICKYVVSCYAKNKYWLRNPHLWLSIPPEEPGWYWWRKNEQSESEIIELFFNMLGIFVAKFMNEKIEIVSNLKGQFQGPIRPKGE